MKPCYRTIYQINIPYAHHEKLLSLSLKKCRKNAQKEYVLQLAKSHRSPNNEWTQVWTKSNTIWRKYIREKIADFIYSHR